MCSWRCLCQIQSYFGSSGASVFSWVFMNRCLQTERYSYMTLCPEHVTWSLGGEERHFTVEVGKQEEEF